ncbi:MAG: metal-dependent hydrolase family protein [Thermoplasmata archaeon]
MIYRGRVFDGSEIHEFAEFAIDESTGTIEYIEDTRKSQEVSGDITFLPGLIDTHIHFFGREERSLFSWTMTPDAVLAVKAVYDAENLLKSGFTTVRTMGDKVSLGLSVAEKEGILRGPRMISSGYSIAQTGGDDDPKFLPYEDSRKRSYSYYCDGPWECRKAVRLNIRNGAESIKAYSSSSFVGGGRIRDELTVDELKAIADEAHRSKVKAASHAYGASAIQNSLDAGFDSIEHGLGLNEDLAAQMAKKGTFYVPTLSVYKSLRREANETRDAMIKRHIETEVKIAQDSGVKIAVGTDFLGTTDEPLGSNWLEILYLSEIIGVRSAIVSATSLAAECLGLGNVGVIGKGFRGDIIGVKGNPFLNIRQLSPESVVLVVKNGKITKHLPNIT